MTEPRVRPHYSHEEQRAILARLRIVPIIEEGQAYLTIGEVLAVWNHRASLEFHLDDYQYDRSAVKVHVRSGNLHPKKALYPREASLSPRDNLYPLAEVFVTRLAPLRGLSRKRRLHR